MAAPELRVLLVDDDPYLAEVFALILNHHNIPHHIVVSGAEALGYLERARVSVIVIELLLAGMDGYQLAKRIRASGVAPGTKLVAMSAFYPNRLMQQAGHHGFDGFIPKPFDVAGIVPYLQCIVEDGCG